MVLPFIGIYFNKELGYSLSEVGLIMTCFGIGSFLGAFSGGVLTDKFGFFNVQWISLMLTAGCFISLIFLQAFIPLCLGVFALSFIADHLRPANWTAVNTFSKKENIVRSVSLMRLAVNAGYTVGPLIGGIIAASFGYKWLFVINASSVFIAGICVFFLFRNKPRKVEIEKTETKTAIQLPWKDKSYVAFLIPFTFLITVFLQLIYSVPLYFKNDLLFDERMIGLVMGLNGGIIFLTEMPIIFLLEKIRTPKFWVFVGGIAMALGFFSFVSFQVAIVAALSYTLFVTIGEIISFPFSSTLALSFSNDANRGKYMGLYTMTFSMASIIAPGLGLYISEHYGFNTLWTLGTIVCVISSVWIYLLKEKEHGDLNTDEINLSA